MKFTQVKTRRFYKAWVYHDIKFNYVVRIYELPLKNIMHYHFTVNILSVFYSSLDDGKYYKSFQETESAVQEWIKINI